MITRSEAIKQLRLLKADIINGLSFISKTKDKNLSLDSLDMAIASLETDEAYDLEYELTKNDLGVDVHDNNVGNIDCISRADAIGIIAVECSAEKLDIDYAKFLMLRRAIKALPTVTSQPRKGHWIDSEAVLVIGYSDTDNFMRLPACECSVCHKPHIRGYGMEYCPNCGAKMVEPQESEEE